VRSRHGSVGAALYAGHLRHHRHQGSTPERADARLLPGQRLARSSDTTAGGAGSPAATRQRGTTAHGDGHQPGRTLAVSCRSRDIRPSPIGHGTPSSALCSPQSPGGPASAHHVDRLLRLDRRRPCPAPQLQRAGLMATPPQFQRCRWPARAKPILRASAAPDDAGPTPRAPGQPRAQQAQATAHPRFRRARQRE